MNIFQDTFHGQIVHTAEWTDAVDLKGKRVAIIGTGASAVQVKDRRSGLSSLKQPQESCGQSYLTFYARKLRL